VLVGVCYTAVDTAAGGLTTGWWALVLECFSSHLLWYLWLKLWDEFVHLTDKCEWLACDKKREKGIVSGDVYIYLWNE